MGTGQAICRPAVLTAPHRACSSGIAEEAEGWSGSGHPSPGSGRRFFTGRVLEGSQRRRRGGEVACTGHGICPGTGRRLSQSVFYGYRRGAEGRRPDHFGHNGHRKIVVTRRELVTRTGHKGWLQQRTVGKYRRIPRFSCRPARTPSRFTA